MSLQRADERRMAKVTIGAGQTFLAQVRFLHL